ncbi:RecT family recombinase [Paenibacillus agricola]|uniref:Recombinase RecT n=1 Tax=Paenibacillus agricola TaxID=2716264 RepID=A0ABX0JK66_9BACL|nr:RecT family recombinase [Paenibacillus agricola]NHN35517.1 recombinase RecT [Paenibacillus agricola]
MSSIEKRIQFSQEQKSMIWSNIIAPKNGTSEEAIYFVEVCEMFGLNPLLKEIAFMKKETKSGSGIYNVIFLTTRDGYLSVARRDNNFVGSPNSAVVKEGDEFGFDSVSGIPQHRFGTKRGAILGAWAVIKHKQYDPVSVFVDFNEYSTANDSSGVWKKNPSAMIQKIAEVFVLRRQFPLSGLYTAEEFGNDEVMDGALSNTNPKSNFEENNNEKPAANTTPEAPAIAREVIDVSTTSNSTTSNVSKPTNEPQNESKSFVEPKVVEETKKAVVAEEEKKDLLVSDIQPIPAASIQEVATDPNPIKKLENGELYKIVNKMLSKHPRTSGDMLKLELLQVSNGSTIKVIANKQELVDVLEKAAINSIWTIVIEENLGFKFVQEVAA